MLLLAWVFCKKILGLVTWSDQAGRDDDFWLVLFVASHAKGHSSMPQVLSGRRNWDFMQRQWYLAFMDLEVMSAQTLSS